jgi:hypothetical protein
MYFKSNIDNVHSAVDSLSVLPEDGPVRPKHVVQTHKLYVYILVTFKTFNDLTDHPTYILL